jgi:geranylgeranyl pyrophosphate synthase
MPIAEGRTQPYSVVSGLILESCGLESRPTDPLFAALVHHLSTSGKQVRAQMTLSCAKALGLDEAVSVRLAAAVECLHNASLVQDDLQDKTALRRGAEPVWKRFGGDTAICLTDLLLSATYALVAGARPLMCLPVLLSRVHWAVSETLRGQMQDTGAEHAGGSGTAAERCLQVAVAKSGPFFALTLELPLIAAGMEHCLPMANNAALHFGKGYQAFDDLEDLEQDEREGNAQNLVLALTRDGGSGDPVKEARKLATYYLNQACHEALALPAGCGAMLCEEAQKLKTKLN